MVYSFTVPYLKGSVVRAGIGLTFADIHDGAGTHVYPDSGQFSAVRMVTGYSHLARHIILFDTSSIVASDKIVSAVLQLGFFQSGGYPESDFNIALVGSTPASEVALAISDYGNLGAVRYADTDVPYFTTAGNKSWTFNAAGLAAINKTGRTKLGLRFAKDCDNAEFDAVTCTYTVNYDQPDYYGPLVLTVTTLEDSGIRIKTSTKVFIPASNRTVTAVHKLRYYDGAAVKGLPLTTSGALRIKTAAGVEMLTDYPSSSSQSLSSSSVSSSSRSSSSSSKSSSSSSSYSSSSSSSSSISSSCSSSCRSSSSSLSSSSSCLSSSSKSSSSSSFNAASSSSSSSRSSSSSSTSSSSFSSSKSSSSSSSLSSSSSKSSSSSSSSSMSSSSSSSMSSSSSSSKSSSSSSSLSSSSSRSSSSSKSSSSSSSYSMVPPESFAGFTEVDEDGDLTVSAYSITASTMQNEANSCVWKDYGAGHFGNFTHKIDVNISAIQNNAQFCVWSASNTSAATLVDLTTVQVGLRVYVLRQLTSSYHLFLQDVSNWNSDVYNFSLDTDYYLTIQRTGNSAVCYIYSDSARTNLLDTLGPFECATTTYRYLSVAGSCDAPPIDTLECSFVVSNLYLTG